MKKRLDQKILPYILIAPAAIMIAVFLVYPMVRNLTLSFYDYSLAKVNRPFVGLQNFKTFFSPENQQAMRFWAAVKRTIIWTGSNLVVAILIGVGAAFLLFSNFKGSSLLKSFVLIPWILPSVITGFIFSLMMNERAGIITWLLRSTHLVDQNFSFFATGGLSMFAAIMANVWRAFPFFTLMIYAKLCTIPTDQVEAAKLEGTNAFQMFRYVYLPFISDTLSSCIFLCFIWTFNAYDIMKVMTNGGPADSTTTMSILIQREAFQYRSLSNAATMSVIAFTIMLSIIIVTRLVKKIIVREK
ncbi:MAG: sugar ABC transporter permease [Sphaerochaetaceae bacterium]|nr:sugar ABC transporter permease [Sphaerochaetaceae bacterium]